MIRIFRKLRLEELLNFSVRGNLGFAPLCPSRGQTLNMALAAVPIFNSLLEVKFKVAIGTHQKNVGHARFAILAEVALWPPRRKAGFLGVLPVM